MSNISILDKVNYPSDLKILTITELETLAEEIRTLIIDVVSKNGGHLAPNLGVVELTIAMHRIFNTPKDKFIFDVGHQAYVHKILTGRKDVFPTLRKYKGLSGFPKREESEYDAFDTGHSSTSISAATGMAIARDLKGEDYNVVALIGDGSMTGGLAYEALNHAGDLKKPLIVILNDNEMSISKNVGAMSEYFYQLRSGETYNKFKNDLENWLKGSEYGDDVLAAIDRVKMGVKTLVTPAAIFEHLGFKYFGPIQGHDMNALLEVLETAKHQATPVLVHVVTKKGKGYKPAEDNPDKFHGTSPFNIETGVKIVNPDAAITYTEVFSNTMLELAADNEKIIAITAAMPDGTGLKKFSEIYPNRFVDVGIAEQHAVTSAAGMATQDFKPFAAIYSTFLQRAYDSVLHDVCIQNLPVTFCIDRAGLVGDDGSTHHGVFDYSYLSGIPNMTVMAPKDENELRHMLKTASEFNGPISIRYPRGSGIGVDCSEPLQSLPIGKAEVLLEGEELVIWAIGSMVKTATKVAELLKQVGINAGVVNIRFAKPLDLELLENHAGKYSYMAVLEEGVANGGVGSNIIKELNNKNLLNKVHVLPFAIEDQFVSQGDNALLLKDLELDAESIAKKITGVIK